MPEALYSNFPFSPEEDAKTVQQLFDFESEQHEIIIYTDHQNVRLAGIFPHHADVAYFGFWETINDAELTAAAFDLLAADARQLNKKSIVGPLHFNTYQRYRLRLGAAPSWQQFDREPVNSSYYPALLQQVGFAPTLNFESRLLRAETVPRVYLEKNPGLEMLPKIPFDFIPVTPENWALYADDIFQLIHQIFRPKSGL